MNEMVFSWVQDANGLIVHVDDVHDGLKCGCICAFANDFDNIGGGYILVGVEEMCYNFDCS